MTPSSSSFIVMASLFVASAAYALGCGGSPASGPDGFGGADPSGAGGGGGAKSSSGAGGATSGAGGDLGFGGGFTGSGGGSGAIPVRKIPGLLGITFYERTGGVEPTAYPFTVDGPELSVRLSDPLSDQNRDIQGAGTEYYDVYYSEADGTFNLDGSYLTISGQFGQALPAGGGLNLAEIGLNFAGQPTEFGNYVASYVALGDNKDESTVDRCIDGDLQTHTTMGNTVGASERLRLTLGFASSSGPPN